MLDLAVFLKPNSRLGKSAFAGSSKPIDQSTQVICLFYQGCQIVLNKQLEGLVVSLPQATRNFYIDGHVPEPH